MKDNELKKMERNLLLRYFEDGLVDIYIGYILVVFGAFILLDIASLTGAFAALGFFIPKILKNRYTYPRRGYIKLKNERRSYVGYILLGVFLLAVFIFFLFSSNTSNWMVEILKDNMLIVVATIWSGALALVALVMRVTRFYVYAVGIFFTILMTIWVGSMGLNLLVLGLLIILSGVLILRQFIRRYPIIQENVG